MIVAGVADFSFTTVCVSLCVKRTTNEGIGRFTHPFRVSEDGKAVLLGFACALYARWKYDNKAERRMVLVE